jgi:hypothetical protein
METIDLREQEAIQLGAKHCIYFGDNNEFRLYLTEINRYVVSGIWNDLVDDPIVACDNLFASVCIQKVSDYDQYVSSKAGVSMGVALNVQRIIGLKKSTLKAL